MRFANSSLFVVFARERHQQPIQRPVEDRFIKFKTFGANGEKKRAAQRNKEVDEASNEKSRAESRSIFFLSAKLIGFLYSCMQNNFFEEKKKCKSPLIIKIDPVMCTFLILRCSLSRLFHV